MSVCKVCEQDCLLVVDPSVEDRILAKVEANDEGCWVWTGHIAKAGYGSIRAPRPGQIIRAGTRTSAAHRVLFALSRFPLTCQQTLHHECGNRACVNPDHLRVMSRRDHALLELDLGNLSAIEAKRSTTHCPKGHPYDEANTYINNNKRFCRACHRESQRRRKEVRAA